MTANTGFPGGGGEGTPEMARRQDVGSDSSDERRGRQDAARGAVTEPLPPGNPSVGVPDAGLLARDAWHRRSGRYLAWLGIRGLAGCMRIVPWRLGCVLGEAVGLAGWAVSRENRKRAEAQLEEAMGPALGDRKAVRRTVRRMFRHLGRSGAEMLMLPYRGREHISSLILNDQEAGSRLKSHMRDGRGILVVSGHVGNWELLAAWLGTQVPTSVVAKRIYYDGFDDVVTGWRARLGLNTIYAHESPRRTLRVLGNGQLVGMLPDQDMSYVAGEFVPFFGKPAWTPTAPAVLAAMARVSLVPIYITREGRRHRVHLMEPIPMVSTGDREADAVANTAAWTEVLEDFIREHPDHWPWFHKRWKTTPEKRGRT